MKERLEALKNKTGAQWREIAKGMGISVPMLGCLRRGERHPSEKVLAKLASIERDAASGVALQVNHGGVDGGKTQPTIFPPAAPLVEGICQDVRRTLDYAGDPSRRSMIETRLANLMWWLCHLVREPSDVNRQESEEAFAKFVAAAKKG